MKKCSRFVGLDDSKNSIDVAVAAEGRECCSAQLFCHFGRLAIMRHVPRVFHETVTQ